MIQPGPDTLMTFAQAQDAMNAMARAYNNAIDGVIEDDELKMRVHGAVAKNILDAFMAKVERERQASDKIGRFYDSTSQSPGAKLIEQRVKDN